MRIEHLVLCLSLIYKASPLDDETNERTNNFIRDRLIPALKLAGVEEVNYTRLHLCHCSREVGCNARTTGWVPSLEEGLNDTEKKFFENTCYTDGNCYQSARPSPEISHFGCMDEKSVTDETEFHDTAAKVCSNSSNNAHASIWICCDKGNFCANETILYLPPRPPNYSGWIIFTFLVVFGCFVAFGVLIFVTRKSWDAKFEWHIRYNAKPDETPRDVENNAENNSVIELIEVDQNNTMSTTIEGSPPGNNPYPAGLPESFKNMLIALEETSGSGTTTLHKVTIGGQITLMSKIGAGRFGSVSRGDYRGEAVAVKIFKPTDEPSFLKEVKIYETRMLRHPHVLRFIGSDRIDNGYVTELWLVTEYHPSGSLHDFLEDNVIKLETFYNLMRSAASGLAFLHTPIPGNKESSKPAMAHRDIKSRNIMVKSDLTCAIGDLGLSLSMPENQTGRVIVENYKCGTVRYLAPEILSSTMQASVFDSYQCADVYSFSLVMWETLCRLEDGEISPRPADMVIPYIEWTDRDPTDEQMLDVVCNRKLRPTENPLWKDHPEIMHVMEVITTCWNANPTARYTSFQCRRRLEERQKLYMNGKKKLASQNAVSDDQKRMTPQYKNNGAPTVPSVKLVPKVYDQETIEHRNGKNHDDSKHPLLD